ncbi:aryl-alcohol dehydrogenase-like predicted oxidoreductase [Lachnotalea glycerini]|nr:aldo/keto reductase [Lachnotalea glycerini]PXV91843.1 aryl-alcohol dehydrogenase-like predicted oxidoreductase [Lachnotalea glycerini]
MAKLCLGTVQFGMQYGIYNKYGQPSMEDCFEMFDIALDSGINKIDTAAAYGIAEELIGKYVHRRGKSNDLEIISKLRPNVLDVESGTPQQIIRAQAVRSLRRMNIELLDGYLLHTPEYIYNSDILEGLQNIKKEGLVKNIGVSIYDIKEGDAAINTGIVDYIQLPYSVFDQRGMIDEFFVKAKQSNITIYCRSAFLQGLILMNENEIPMHLIDAKKYVTIFNELVQKYDVNAIDTLIHFVYDNEYIDYLVFGVDTKEQLKYDIEAVKKKSMPVELMTEIEDKLKNIGKSIIIPSLWKKN